MRTQAQTVLLAALLLPAYACGDDSGATTSEGELVCEEPTFVPGVNPDWAPCGCSRDGEWFSACEGDGAHVCLFDRGQTDEDLFEGPRGGTCAPKGCTTDADCAPYGGHAARCHELGTCFLPCGGGCPEGLRCTTWAGIPNEDMCLHNFPPDEP